MRVGEGRVVLFVHRVTKNRQEAGELLHLLVFGRILLSRHSVGDRVQLFDDRGQSGTSLFVVLECRSCVDNGCAKKKNNELSF